MARRILANNGSAGAALSIMGTSSDLSLDEWSTVTNVTITNIASIAETNQPGSPTDLLDAAFVPGTLTLAMGAGKSPAFKFFQAVMPYD